MPAARFALRGDSTLRGHVLEEYLALRDATMPASQPILLLAMALPSAGRVTVGGVHWLESDGRRIALHETEYARDEAFGYQSARLLDWAEERTSGLLRAAAGRELGLDDLRDGGADLVAENLVALGGEGRAAAFAPDAETAEDLALIAAGLDRALELGAQVIVRAAPAFVGVASGTTALGFAPPPRADHGILVVCGSYVPTTTRQLERLLEARPGNLIEVDVEALDSKWPEAEIERAARSADERLARTGLAVVATPRERPAGLRTLEAGERIALNLALIVQRLARRPRTIVAKGGDHLGRDPPHRTRRDRRRRRRPRSARRVLLASVERDRRGLRLPGRSGQRGRRCASHRPRRRPRDRPAAMIAPFRALLEERRAVGGAVGAFTCYDGTTAAGVVLAAEARAVPVMLLIGERSFRARDGRLLTSALIAIAREARVPACVQLDHVGDLGLIEAALSAGVGAVMADGSRLPLAENTLLVREARAVASRHGAEVEAELGHVAGDEDAALGESSRDLTDPDEAAAFVAATGAACLAVSIGNVHGHYSLPPRLDWPRLEEIGAGTDVPLSLHGASGLSEDDVRRAVALGVCKVNVNTELRERLFAELERRLPETAAGYRVLDLDAALVEAIAEVVDRKLELLSGN